MAGRVMIDVQTNRGLAILELSNPDRQNAISAGMWESIGKFARAAVDRQDIRVILVRGSSGIFSAGADISDFDAARSNASEARAYDDLIEMTCRQLEAVPQPTIALINGICFGAGASLAASCDLRVASEDAVFAVPAAKLGLGYDVRGIQRFVRVFGAGATAFLLYTADRLSANRAHAFGAVHVLAPKAHSERVAFELADRIASNAPLTIRAAKLGIRAITQGVDGLLTEAERLASAADSSADYREGRTAFAEKRKPHFAGC
jgi:enoyl-CoA hydratase/carnithine racemase